MEHDYIVWRDILDTFQSMNTGVQVFCLFMTGFLIWATGRGFCRLMVQLFARSAAAPLPEGQYWMVVDAQGGVRLESLDEPPQLSTETNQRHLGRLG